MKTLLLPFFLIFYSFAIGQTYQTQYFEGADTSYTNSVIFIKDSSDTNNIWQVGPPQKTVFTSASTVPNALVTDTLNPYPINDTSRITANFEVPFISMGVWALNWNQKLDFDSTGDGGILEFTVDGGATWENVFTSPYTYNFYGYTNPSAGIVNGEPGFVGKDPNWKNIWLCYDLSWLSTLPDTLSVRYSIISDSIYEGSDGWMIDDYMSQETWVHTLTEKTFEGYMTAYPNPANDILYIETEKQDKFHIIESLDLYDMSGAKVIHFENIPTKFHINVSSLSEGVYMLHVKTNLRTEKFEILVKH